MPTEEELRALMGDGSGETKQEEKIDLRKLASNFEYTKRKDINEFLQSRRLNLQGNKRGIVFSDNETIFYIFADTHGCKIDFEAAIKTVTDALAKGENAVGIFNGDFLDGLKRWDVQNNIWVPSYPDQSLEILAQQFQLKQMAGDRFIFLAGDHEAKEIFPNMMLRKFGEDIPPKIPMLIPDQQPRIRNYIKNLPLFVKIGDSFLVCHTGPSPVRSLEEAMNFTMDSQLVPSAINYDDRKVSEEVRKKLLLSGFLWGIKGKVELDGHEKSAKLFPEKESEDLARAMDVKKILIGHVGTSTRRFEVDGRWLPAQVRAVPKIEENGRYIVEATAEGEGYEKPRGPDGKNNYGCFIRINPKNKKNIMFAEMGSEDYEIHYLAEPRTQIAVPEYIPGKTLSEKIDEELTRLVLVKGMNPQFRKSFRLDELKKAELSGEIKKETLEETYARLSEEQSHGIPENELLKLTRRTYLPLINPDLHRFFHDEKV